MGNGGLHGGFHKMRKIKRKEIAVRGRSDFFCALRGVYHSEKCARYSRYFELFFVIF